MIWLAEKSGIYAIGGEEGGWLQKVGKDVESRIVGLTRKSLLLAVAAKVDFNVGERDISLSREISRISSAFLGIATIVFRVSSLW